MPDISHYDWHMAHEYVSRFVPEHIKSLELNHGLKPDSPTQPSIGLEVAQLMAVLVHSHRPKRVLEIGTSAGFSAIVMGEALKQVGGKLVTIEIDPRSAQKAEENIREAGLMDVVEIRVEDANESIKGFNEPFGLILQDGDKDDYLQLLKPLVGLLEPGGMLITDDVLFPAMDVPEDVKRYQYALSLYNTSLYEHPELKTVWLPIEEGVALSVKLQGKS